MQLNETQRSELYKIHADLAKIHRRAHKITTTMQHSRTRAVRDDATKALEIQLAISETMDKIASALMD